MASKTRVIKKYSNRRLYDMALKRSITLEDIKNLVMDGQDFQVIEAKTKKDITQSTLLQIIAEQEANGLPIFSIPLLKMFIRFYPEKAHDVFSQYLEQAIDFFIQQKKFFSNQWESYQDMFTGPFDMTNFNKNFKKKK
jgi:polyhydroxyalkanoate synthesis repressor PhaR